MKKNIIIVITSLSSFMTAFMGSSLNVAIPSIGDEFYLSPVFLSWIASSYLLTTAVFLVPIGKLADIYGRVRFFHVGIIIFTIGSGMAFFSSDGVQLIILRISQGFGASFMFVTSTAILISSTQNNQRGKALGINVAAVYIGLSIGPFLGGIISQQLNWRWIFMLNSCVGVLLIFASRLFIKSEWRVAENDKFDFIGSFVMVTSLISFLLGITLIPNFHAYILISLGISGFFLFSFVQKRVEFPVLNLNIVFTNRVFKFSSLASLINYSATFAVGFLMSLFLQYIKGLTPQEAGIILVCQPITQAFFSPITGKLSDKYQPRILSSLGMLIISFGLAFLIFITTTTDILLIAANLSMLGVGFALFSSPNANAVMSSVDNRNFGIANTMLSLMRLLGQMLSMGFVIIIISTILGQNKISLENSEGFLLSLRIIFSSFVFFSLLGVFASLARGNMTRM